MEFVFGPIFFFRPNKLCAWFCYDSIRLGTIPTKLILVELEIWRSQYMYICTPNRTSMDYLSRWWNGKEKRWKKKPHTINQNIEIKSISVVSSAIFGHWYWLLAFLYFHFCLLMLEWRSSMSCAPSACSSWWILVLEIKIWFGAIVLSLYFYMFFRLSTKLW